MKEGMEDLEKNKNDLFNQRLAKASINRSEPWSREQLVKVLKSLKKGKSRDPWNLCNEIFKPEVAGDDLIEALLWHNSYQPKVRSTLHVPEAQTPPKRPWKARGLYGWGGLTFPTP